MLQSPTRRLGDTPYSREAGTLVTLAGPEPAEVILVLDLVDDAVVVAAHTVAHIVFETTFSPPQRGS